MVNHPNRSKAKFHEGQEVEVRIKAPTQDGGYWRKGKILCQDTKGIYRALYPYWIEFPDNTRAVFDEENIRAIVPPINEGKNWKGQPIMFDQHGRAS